MFDIDKIDKNITLIEINKAIFRELGENHNITHNYMRMFFAVDEYTALISENYIGDYHDSKFDPEDNYDALNIILSCGKNLDKNKSETLEYYDISNDKKAQKIVKNNPYVLYKVIHPDAKHKTIEEASVKDILKLLDYSLNKLEAIKKDFLN